MFSGDEWLAGTDPSQGVELCAVVEFAFTLEHLVRIFGDHGFADRLERVVYNALPATISADMRARQYDQQPNQVLCSVAKRNWTANRDDANIFGLEPDFGCCTANLHQGWPKYVGSMWMQTANGGLAATAYGPCRVAVGVKGAAVTIRETTEYPFGDEVRFDFSVVSPPTRFPLVLRVPEWCGEAEVRVNGERQHGFDRPGFHPIDRVWSTGDVAELSLPTRIRLEERPSGGVSVQRGPLTFALRVGEEWRKIGREEPFADWEVHPTTPWNYALAVDRGAPESAFTLERREISPLPWAGEEPPMILRGRGGRVPSWKLIDNSAGSVPASPVTSDAPLESIELIPYGCARLRVTELPTTHP